ncbi:unnamed protein product [Oikopleura dioica]|uniref:C-type lectin domain-containing protein n=1 Tax=Oikopleura dioica TaxID=34765 RepID=E4XAL4_OIKDI|nr:unnamed protein product [Oikopleura dioica]
MNFAYDADVGRANYYWDDNFPIASTDAQGFVEIFPDGTWGISNSTSASLPYICKIENVPTPNPDSELGDSSCEPGWHLLLTDKGEEDLDGKYCYRQRTEPKDFAEAYGDCNVFGATIMSIHSEYEDKFAQSIIGHANAWLGAINMPDGNGEVYPTGWQWLDETAFKYTNWAEGEPSLNNDEYCLELWTNGFWNDNACTDRKPYVCQKRAIHSFCAVPGPDRQLCGPQNIDEMECADGFGCCWDPEIDQCFRPESTFQCLEMGGSCKPKDFIDCNRGIGPGVDICPLDKRCCLDCQTDQCTNEEEQWETDDGECLLAQGQCIFDTLSCSQVIGDGGVFGSEQCGGPDDRRCCKKPTGPSTVTVTVTVPASTGTTDPSGGGLSGGAIFGIVFGVLCTIIIAGTIAYFSGKNKSSAPLGKNL